MKFIILIKKNYIKNLVCHSKHLIIFLLLVIPELPKAAAAALGFESHGLEGGEKRLILNF